MKPQSGPSRVRFGQPRQHLGSLRCFAFRVILLPAFRIKGDLCVNAKVCDFAVLHFSGEFLDVERTNIPQRLRRFSYRALRGGFPALRRLGYQFDDLTTFAMAIILFLSFTADDCALRVTVSSNALLWTPLPSQGKGEGEGYSLGIPVWISTPHISPLPV